MSTVTSFLQDLLNCHTYKSIVNLTKNYPECTMSPRESSHFDLCWKGEVLSNNIASHKDYNRIRRSVHSMAKRKLL